MLPSKFEKATSRMKSSKAHKKEAGSFFKQDGSSFFSQNKHQKQRKQMPSQSDNKDKGHKTAGSNIVAPSTKLHAPATFETRDRLVSSVQSYMALFCSLSDAGVSLTTSVHSVLSEIGFMEIAGQFSKGFNDINDISTATFEEMKDFVEKVVGAWETSSDGKCLTVQSVLQVLAYLLKTQLNFLQTASEHISEVLHTQYSGKTMLELLGGEAFFLTPPSTPTKTSVSSTPTASQPTKSVATTMPPHQATPATSDTTSAALKQAASDAKTASGLKAQSAAPVVRPKEAKTPSDKSPASNSLQSTASETSSKTASEENINYAPPPSDIELNNIIDLLSGANALQSQPMTNANHPANQTARPPHNHPSVLPPNARTSQYTPFLYHHVSLQQSQSSRSANGYQQTAPPPHPPSQAANQNVFMSSPYDVTGAAILNQNGAGNAGGDFAANKFVPGAGDGVIGGNAGGFATIGGDAGYLDMNQPYLDPSGQPIALNQTLEAEQNKLLKTHTWPMRPNKEPPGGIPPSRSMFQPGRDGSMAATDLEFSQYVNAIQRISARAAAGAGPAGGGSMGSSRGSLDNPWSAGDSAMAWPPYVNMDSQERKQWLEDSSNCSDESSSNNGGDWMVGPELLSAIGGGPGGRHQGQQQQNAAVSAKEAFIKAVPPMSDARTTNTWPGLKPSPWSANTNSTDNTPTNPNNPIAQADPIAATQEAPIPTTAYAHLPYGMDSSMMAGQLPLAAAASLNEQQQFVQKNNWQTAAQY